MGCWLLENLNLFKHLTVFSFISKRRENRKAKGKICVLLAIYIRVAVAKALSRENIKRYWSYNFLIFHLWKYVWWHYWIFPFIYYRFVQFLYQIDFLKIFSSVSYLNWNYCEWENVANAQCVCIYIWYSFFLWLRVFGEFLWHRLLQNRRFI